MTTTDPFTEIVYEFENKIATFFNSPYAIAVDSCTHAIELCLRYKQPDRITVPKRTYVSIPMIPIILGLEWDWKEEYWKDYYYIGNTNIIDAAVYWKQNGYIKNTYMCLSFQFQKHLSLGRGGMILLDDRESYITLKKMSYDGRTPGVPWRNQDIDTIGYHYYMTPETAQLGIDKLDEAINKIPRQWVLTDWPDLTQMSVFK